MDRKEQLFDLAKGYANTYGTDTLTRIILEERGELTEERAKEIDDSGLKLEELIRKTVRMGLNTESTTK